MTGSCYSIHLVTKGLLHQILHFKTHEVGNVLTPGGWNGRTQDRQKSWKLPCPIGETISTHWGFEMVKWLKMSHYSIFCHITPPFWLSWRDPGYQHLNPELWFQRADGQHLKQQQGRSGETLYFKYFPINCFVWNTETWTLAFTLFLFPYLHKKYSLVNFTSGWKHPQQGKGFITLWKVMGGGEADRKGEWNSFKEGQSSDSLYRFCGIKINF